MGAGEWGDGPAGLARRPVRFGRCAHQPLRLGAEAAALAAPSEKIARGDKQIRQGASWASSPLDIKGLPRGGGAEGNS